MTKERCGVFEVVRDKAAGQSVATCTICHARFAHSHEDDLDHLLAAHPCGRPEPDPPSVAEVEEATAALEDELLAMTPPEPSHAPSGPASIPAYLDVPACPWCSSACALPGLLYSHEAGDLVCASCGHVWRGTASELEQAGRAERAWETRTDGRRGPWGMVVRRRARRGPNANAPAAIRHQESLFRTRG